MIRKVRCLLFVPLFLAVAVAGCKSGSTPTQVSGKVTYNGGPVTGGVIRFGAPGQDASAQGYVKEDGTYTVSDVPQGEMIVWINTEEINPEPKGKPKGIVGYGQPGQKEGMSGAASMIDSLKKGKMDIPAGAGGTVGKYMPIPDKYQSKKDSTLRATCKGGKQTGVDFTLTD
jgi:hypothetical protein